MRTRWQQWLLIGALVLGQHSTSAAQATSEVDILLDKLVEKGVLSSADAGVIRREISETKETRNKELAKEIVPDSARNWTWKGDIRLRNDYRNRTGSGQDVNRQRIRFRYGFDAKVSDALKVGARFVTGNTTDPISTNQTFDTSFNHKNFLLDRAFVQYTPDVRGVDDIKLIGGMMENPFWTVGQLVWDDDLNVDGAAVHLAKRFGPATVFTNNGVFPLQSGITEAAVLWSTQGGVSIQPFADAEADAAKHLKLTAAVAYHDYANVSNPLSESTAQTTAGGAKGNTAGIQDFNLLNPTVELSTQHADVPCSIFGDWVHNTAVASGNNGFQVGLKVGKARRPLDLRTGWEGGYYFERIEPDAAFGPFVDSDFGNGGTDHRGHVWWTKFAVLKNSDMTFKYFNTEELKSAKNHADTFQADWVTKF